MPSSQLGEGKGNLTAKKTTTAPNASESRRKGVTSVGSHSSLDDLERLAQRRDLEHVETSPKQQIAELDGLLL